MACVYGLVDDDASAVVFRGKRELLMSPTCLVSQDESQLLLTHSLSFCLQGNSGGGSISLAPETSVSSISAITVTPDGVVHVADDSGLQVLSVVPFIPGPDENLLFSMTSPGSHELYIFNKYGQHVFTKNALTNQVLYSFVYDVDTSFGRLSTVTDVTGSRVSFLRDSSRNLASVETSVGLKCRVSVNGQGLLDTFLDPENLTSRFFYETTSGLMTTRRDSSGFNLFYKYDPNGRLVGVIADSF